MTLDEKSGQLVANWQRNVVLNVNFNNFYFCEGLPQTSRRTVQVIEICLHNSQKWVSGDVINVPLSKSVAANSSFDTSTLTNDFLVYRWWLFAVIQCIICWTIWSGVPLQVSYFFWVHKFCCRTLPQTSNILLTISNSFSILTSFNILCIPMTIHQGTRVSAIFILKRFNITTF